MCLIIIKEPGVGMPTEKFISDVWESNPHGGGLLYQKEGTNTILMEKGFMDLKGYLEHIESMNIKEGDYVALHLRWATSGKTNKITSHPFVVHKQQEVRNILSCQSDKHLFMMHNGQIYDLDRGKKMSDTQKFARDYMTSIAAKDLYENDVIQELIEKFIDGSRLLFAHGVHGFLRLGDWIEKENGLLLSKEFIQRRKHVKTSSFPSPLNRWNMPDGKQSTLWEDEGDTPDYGEATCGWCGYNKSVSSMIWSDDYDDYVCHPCNTDNSLCIEEEKECVIECDKCGNWEVVMNEQEKYSPYSFSFMIGAEGHYTYKCDKCLEIVEAVL